MNSKNPIINQYLKAKEKRIAESIAKQPLISEEEILERAKRLKKDFKFIN